MTSLITITILNIIGVILFAIYDEKFQDNLPDWFPNSSNAYIIIDFFIYTFFSIAGAILGR